ncbi:MAG: phosphoglycerate mutase family protein [Bryobacteraceae bacterium]
MSQLTLVRHGQASYMAENYDKLSPLGERQARKLGEFWLKAGVSFDRVFQGPAQRHIRTAEIVADVYRHAETPWPEATIISALDEFDATLLLQRLMPMLCERHEPVRLLQEAYKKGLDSPHVGLLLERLFEEVARHWSLGSIHAADVESWAEFQARVRRGIDSVRSSVPKSSKSVVFTSGGPIAATVGLVQDLAPQKAIELVWVSKNSAYSEFLFSGERFSLSSFNTHPHLDDRGLLTYR